MLIFFIPTIDCWSVLGIGVAVKVSTSTPSLIDRICSLCLTPNLCSSSIIKRPKLDIETSLDKMR